MQRQRDERGRFARGNTVSVGNRGNTHPKYGNKNAMKHGLYTTTFAPLVSSYYPNLLNVYISRAHCVTFDSDKGEWIRRKDGSIEIRGEKAMFLESIGMPLLDA